MDELTRATVRIVPIATSRQPTVEVDAVVAAIPAEQVLGKDDGPPVVLDIATMLDATFVTITESSVIIRLADERRVDDMAFDEVLAGGDIDDFDPAAMEEMEKHSGLENAAHEKLPLSAIPEIPELVLAILDVTGDWRVKFNGKVVEPDDIAPKASGLEDLLGGLMADEPAPPKITGPYGEELGMHWARSVVRALIQSEELELVTSRSQGPVTGRVADILEDLTADSPIPVGKIVDRIIDMEGVAELYADDDAVRALFEEHRPS